MGAGPRPGHCLLIKRVRKSQFHYAKIMARELEEQKGSEYECKLCGEL